MTMDSSDVCPTEDAIKALLENLVDPLLPFKPSSSDVPSKALCESVAKQVHAVVLLYNHYHRRDHPHLECLSFEAFRSLATVMRPALLQHFKIMKESSEPRQDGDLEQTSLLEQFIADACNLSMSLNSSLDLSSLEKWPIKKVAVLLVDSKKMNCYLQHSLITQGVWSLLETPIEQKKTVAEDQHGNQVKNEEVTFQKAAFSTIKEATGVNSNNIVILERHLVNSLSEERTGVCFYIMNCTSEYSFPGPVPIEEVLNCMQGPLFERCFTEWTTNPIVEYYHVLPYASIIADWFSRREDTEVLIEKEAEAVCDDVESNGKTDAANKPEVSEENDALMTNDTNVKKAAYPKARRKPTPRTLKRYLKGRENVPNMLLSENKAKNSDNERTPCKEIYANGEKCGFENEVDLNDDRGRGNWKKKAVLDDSNLNLDKLQTTLLSKATLISKTALKVLLHKRDKLTLQQREIEDEIAKCDKCIQNVIKGDSELQLDTILECCSDAYPRPVAQDTTTRQQPLDKSSTYKRMKLCGSLPPTKSSCQKLDDICVENDWALPDYSVSPSDGGFLAQVRIKETHFAHAISGEERLETQESRESAAACLLTKLHNYS